MGLDENIFSDMMDYVVLGALGGVLAAGVGLFAYVKLLKKRLKRYVLRHEKIEKYFRDDEERFSSKRIVHE